MNDSSMDSSNKETQQQQYGGFASIPGGADPPPYNAPPPAGQPPPGTYYPTTVPPPPGYLVVAQPYPPRYERTAEETRSALRFLAWPLAILSCFCGGLCLGTIPLIFACEF